MSQNPKAMAAAIRIRDEIARIIGHPIFQSSPAQRALLTYLGDRAIERRGPPSQTEIATEALGRRDDYDPTSDSSVRVQVSRLRKNLWRYYAIEQSPDGLCLHVPPGRYELLLATRERAYPQPESKAAPSPSEPPSPVAPSPVEPPSTFPPDVPVAEPAAAPARARTASIRRWWIPAAIAAGLATLAVLLWWLGPLRPAPEREGPPVVALEVADTSGLDPEAARQYGQLVAVARRQFDYSLVSDTVEGHAEAGDYIITISAHPLGNGTGIRIRAIDATGNVFLRAEHPLDQGEETRAAFASDMLYLTSLNGLIAQRELDRAGAEPGTAYQCFLTIENRRGEGSAVTDLVNECRARFPGSRYEPIWLTRLAFAEYQAAIIAGEAIERSGRKWSYLQEALERDPFNPYATLVAAKVELANGNCGPARELTNRALSYGQSYPTLISSAFSDLENCPGIIDEPAIMITEFERIAETSTFMDPLQGLYLVIASIALDRPDIARKIAALIDPGSKGEVSNAARLFARSVLEPGFFDGNRSRVGTVLTRFVWGERARISVLDWLDRNGGEIPAPSPTTTLAPE